MVSGRRAKAGRLRRGRRTIVTEQLKAATIRGLYGAFWTSGATFFTLFSLGTGAHGQRIEDAAIGAAGAFFAYMVSRGIAEGLIDSSRQASGNVTPADVGQPTR
jgi:hypothetical protein